MKFPVLLSVDVTLTDMAYGKMGNFMACPIALALRRAGFEKFSVTESAITFSNGVVYKCPAAASQFIKLYDAGYVPRSRTFYFRRHVTPFQQAVLV
jgi:hypothetical protein